MTQAWSERLGDKEGQLAQCRSKDQGSMQAHSHRLLPILIQAEERRACCFRIHVLQPARWTTAWASMGRTRCERAKDQGSMLEQTMSLVI